MNDDSDTEASRSRGHHLPERSRRRAPLIISAVVASVALVTGIAFATGMLPSEADSATPRPAASSVPDPEPSANPSASIEPSATPDAVPAPAEVTAEEEITAKTATVAVESLLVALASHAADPSADSTTLDALATGAILDEIEADTEELEANDWTRSGNATVDGVRIVSTDAAATPATATVEACIDSTNVRLLGSDGKPIGEPSTTPRSLNIYSLFSDGTTWRVASRTFPDNPAC